MGPPTWSASSAEARAARAGAEARQRRVLVMGASGFVGRALAARLQGERPLRLLGRSAARIPEVDGAERVEADALDAASLGPAMEGVHTLVYLIHSMAGPQGSRFERRDREAARITVEAAERAGVERIVYLGGLGAGNGLSPHLASRQEVGRILRSGAPRLTELRAAIIVGKGGASFEMMRQLVQRLPVMVCPRWVRSRCQPIALPDVLECIAACLDHDATAGQRYDIGGPEVLSYKAMMEILGEEMGRVPLVVVVPVLTPQLSAYWVDLVTSTPHTLAHALIEGLRNDVLVQGATLAPYLPTPPMGYRAAVRLALRGGP